jgi:hypothetical protein
MAKWLAGSGVGLTWTSCFGTELNSLANGNAILSATSITNGTALDIYVDVSFKAGSAVTTAAPNYLGLFVYPLNQDAATYGDGRFGSSAAGPPPSNYWAKNIGFPAAASTTIVGVFQGVVIPPGTCKFVLYNQAGVPLPASGNVGYYRTYNIG